MATFAVEIQKVHTIYVEYDAPNLESARKMLGQDNSTMLWDFITDLDDSMIDLIVVEGPTEVE